MLEVEAKETREPLKLKQIYKELLSLDPGNQRYIEQKNKYNDLAFKAEQNRKSQTKVKKQQAKLMDLTTTEFINRFNSFQEQIDGTKLFVNKQSGEDHQVTVQLSSSDSDRLSFILTADSSNNKLTGVVGLFSSGGTDIGAINVIGDIATMCFCIEGKKLPLSVREDFSREYIMPAITKVAEEGNASFIRGRTSYSFSIFNGCVVVTAARAK